VLLDHLDAQLESSRRLLKILIDQTDAIRRQDVDAVLARLTDVQAELAQRDRLERERSGILGDAGRELGLDPEQVELDDLLLLAEPDEAAAARLKSAELKGLLSELARVHGHNRVLIRQELAFLDHLMRALAGQPEGGYTPSGRVYAERGPTTVDTRA